MIFKIIAILFSVDSNDMFYGSDVKFINEINKICASVLEEILNHIKILNSSKLYAKQVSCLKSVHLVTKEIVKN